MTLPVAGLLRNEFAPTLIDWIDLAVRIVGVVIRLNQRAAVGGYLLVVILAARLNDQTGGGVAEFGLVKGVKSRGVGRCVNGILAGAVVGQGTIRALAQGLLSGPSVCQQAVIVFPALLHQCLKLPNDP